MARVSVPLWEYRLSALLPVIALVGHYPTNKLIGRRLLHYRAVKRFPQSFALVTNNLQPTTYNSTFVVCCLSKSHEVAVLIVLKVKPWGYGVLVRLSPNYSPVEGRFLRITHPSAADATHNTQQPTNNYFDNFLEKPPSWLTTSAHNCKIIFSSEALMSFSE